MRSGDQQRDPTWQQPYNGGRTRPYLLVTKDYRRAAQERFSAGFRQPVAPTPASLCHSHAYSFRQSHFQI